VGSSTPVSYRCGTSYRVIEVENGTARVDPDPGITDTISSKLGWGSAKQDETYGLEPDHVETVTDDEIRLDQ